MTDDSLEFLEQQSVPLERTCSLRILDAVKQITVRCGRPARFIVNCVTGGNESFLVCAYHARSYQFMNKHLIQEQLPPYYKLTPIEK